MQLGTRWDVGSDAPDSLPDEVHRAIQRVEAELEADGIDALGWRWTLTWLERRPIVELDDGTRIVQQADGAVVVLASPDADD